MLFHKDNQTEAFKEELQNKFSSEKECDTRSRHRYNDEQIGGQKRQALHPFSHSVDEEGNRKIDEYCEEIGLLT